MKIVKGQRGSGRSTGEWEVNGRVGGQRESGRSTGEWEVSFLSISNKDANDGKQCWLVLTQRLSFHVADPRLTHKKTNIPQT